MFKRGDIVDTVALDPHIKTYSVVTHPYISKTIIQLIDFEGDGIRINYPKDIMKLITDIFV